MKRGRPDPAADDAQKLQARAVGDDRREDFPLAFAQADDRDLPGRTPTALAPHPAWPEVALLNLDEALPERGGRRRGQRHHAPTQEALKPMGGVPVHPCHLRRTQGRHVRRPQAQHPTEIHLQTARTDQILVSHCLSASEAEKCLLR